MANRWFVLPRNVARAGGWPHAHPTTFNFHHREFVEPAVGRRSERRKPVGFTRRTSVSQSKSLWSAVWRSGVREDRQQHLCGHHCPGKRADLRQHRPAHAISTCGQIREWEAYVFGKTRVELAPVGADGALRPGQSRSGDGFSGGRSVPIMQRDGSLLAAASVTRPSTRAVSGGGWVGVSWLLGLGGSRRLGGEHPDEFTRGDCGDQVLVSAAFFHAAAWMAASVGASDSTSGRPSANCVSLRVKVSRTRSLPASMSMNSADVL